MAGLLAAPALPKGRRMKVSVSVRFCSGSARLGPAYGSALAPWRCVS